VGEGIKFKKIFHVCDFFCHGLLARYWNKLNRTELYVTGNTAKHIHTHHVQVIAAVNSSVTKLIIGALVDLVFLVSIAVGTVDSLDMLAQWTGIRVALVTAADLANVRFLHTTDRHGPITTCSTTTTAREANYNHNNNNTVIDCRLRPRCCHHGSYFKHTSLSCRYICRDLCKHDVINIQQAHCGPASPDCKK